MNTPEIEQQVIERMGQMYHDYSCVCAELYDIRTGKSVVVPCDIEHARMMVLVGQHYIDEQHRQTFNALNREYQRG